MILIKKKLINNTDLLDNYLILNDKNYIKNQKDVVDTTICPDCNIEMTIYNTESITICEKCGKINYIILDSNKPSYKDPPPEISYFAYKRINHFNEWLCQFQGKETTDIPEDIYNKILLEIKKERITDMNLVTPIKVRQYLKKLKLNKYYEHTTHIINRLNSSTSGILDKDTEDKLRRMFRDIHEPFIKVCPKNRKIFLSYSYVLNKFVELLQMPELKQYFPLLKSREKLHQQDIIWKDICKILDWPYHKSILPPYIVFNCCIFNKCCIKNKSFKFLVFVYVHVERIPPNMFNIVPLTSPLYSILTSLPSLDLY